MRPLADSGPTWAKRKRRTDMTVQYSSPDLRYADILSASGLMQTSIQEVDPFLESGVDAETYSRDGSGYNWDLDN